jgi:hypothetical protein
VSAARARRGEFLRAIPHAQTACAPKDGSGRIGERLVITCINLCDPGRYFSGILPQGIVLTDLKIARLRPEMIDRARKKAGAGCSGGGWLAPLVRRGKLVARRV